MLLLRVTDESYYRSTDDAPRRTRVRVLQLSLAPQTTRVLQLSLATTLHGRLVSAKNFLEHIFSYNICEEPT